MLWKIGAIMSRTRVLKPLNKKPIYTKQELEAREKQDKKMVDVFYYSEDEANHVVDFDKYENFQSRWLLYHGKRQKIPYMVYKYITDHCYRMDHPLRVNEKGEQIQDEKGVKKYFHKLELLE